MSLSRRSFLKSTGALSGTAASGITLPTIARAVNQASQNKKKLQQGEKYVKTTCVHCVNFCGQNIKMEDDIIRVVYPDPARAEVYNKGICPKGGAGPFNTYNPYRIKAPLKRTNPKKGPDEDPGWVEISWPEALDTVADKLKKIRADDPRKLIWHHGHGKYLIQDGFPKSFAKAFGTPNVVHRTTTCEAARHVGDELTWGHHEFLPDLDYCQLQLNLGANFFEAEQWARWLDHSTTDAKERGMKLISVEPRLSNTGAKADQWIPIRPGKDVVLLLGLMHLFIDADTVDHEYLIEFTNSTHLVASDGHIIHNKAGEPLVWDTVSQRATTYKKGVKPALRGNYSIGNKNVRPSFQILADEVKEITPEYAENVTGIPSKTIKDLAQQMVKAAHIGSTIVLDGKRLRYRPVAIHAFRGVAAKEYGAQTWRSGQLVMMLLGAHDAVGGMRLHHPKPGSQMEASKCEYPPQRVDLQKSVYFPHATHNVCQQVAHTLLDPEAYGLPYKPEMQIFYATNRAFSTSDALKQFEGYAKTFNVVIDIVLTETASMADIVFPDLTYLEAWQFSPSRWTPVSSHTAIRQPLTNAYNIPLDAWGIIWQLAKRTGIRDEYIKAINKKFKLKKQPLNTGRDYVSKDAVKALWREKTGKPFSYAIEHAFIGKRLNVEEMYLHGVEKIYKGPGKPKMKLYADQLLGTYNNVVKTVKKHNIKNIDLKKYKIACSPLPRKEHAFPTPHREAKQLPFYLLTYKRMYRNQAGNTAQNPILNRLGDSDENYILINTKTAEDMGVKNDQQLVIESRLGKAQGKARLSQGIRPDVVAVSYHYGHWSSGFPDAAKKGIWINPVLELHPDVLAGMNSFNDTKCKVYKA